MAEQMRDARRIQDPRRRRVQRPEIRIAVDVGQADIGMAAAEACDNAERDRAVATDHQRALTAANQVGHGLCYLPGDLRYGGQVPGPRIRVVDSEDRAGQVTGVGDADPAAQSRLTRPAARSAAGALSWPA